MLLGAFAFSCVQQLLCCESNLRVLPRSVRRVVRVANPLSDASAGGTSAHVWFRVARINKFLSDRAAGIVGPSKTPRKRDVEDRTRYRRWSKSPTVVRGQTTKEKRQAAAKGRKGTAPAAVSNEMLSEADAFDNAADTAAG